MRLHESSLHHASRRSSGCGEGIPSEDCDSVSLPRLRSHRVSKAARRKRHRSPFARLVPTRARFRTLPRSQAFLTTQHFFCSIFDLCCYRAHCLQSWLQESLTIHGTRHHLGCSTRSHELHISHTHKTENGFQIRIDKVQRARGSARRIDSTAGGEDRSLLAVEQSLRSAFGVDKRMSAANDLVNPELEHRGDGEVVH